MSLVYQPRQPFLEESSDAYVSCEQVARAHRIQFYSFIVSGDPQRAPVAVPDGTIDVVFHCNTPEPQAHVYGSVKKGTLVPFVLGGLYFGVRFYPSAAESLLACPLDEFTEKAIPLSDVVPRAREVMEQICRHGQFQSRVDLFRQFHQTMADQRDPVPRIVSYLLGEIHTSQGELRVHELEEKSGYSARHLENLFKRHVGMGPKFYSRVVRFQRALRSIKTEHPDDWSRIAEEAGYYDQAHFINEFRTFCTKTPRQLCVS